MATTIAVIPVSKYRVAIVVDGHINEMNYEETKNLIHWLTEFMPEPDPNEEE